MPSLFPYNPVGLPRTAGGVYYEIDSVNPGPRRTWGASNSRTVITARVRFEEAPQFVTDLVGRVSREAGGGTVQIRRVVPEVIPDFITPALQHCVMVDHVDQGDNPDIPGQGPAIHGPTGWPRPRWVRYRCVFEGLPYLVNDDRSPSTPELYRYVTRAVRSRAKEMRIPGGGWKTVPAGVQIMHTEHVVVPFADVMYVWHRVPFDAIPRNALRNLEGKINSVNWDIDRSVRGLYWPERTLLFKGWDDSKQYWDANGTYVCDVTYLFEYNPQTWWKFPSKTAAGGKSGLGWQEVSDDGTSGGRHPYETGDFNLLFLPE
jgi:hypothetical protein